MSLPEGLLDTGPAVIGATGGSGTRVVARIVREAGLFTGAAPSAAEDALKFGDYSDRWINAFLSQRPLSADTERAMIDDLAALLREHCGPLASGQAWGWKEPRSIYLLPFFHGQLPALRFLHVVRDGRDMALSTNQNQLRKHGPAAPIPPDLPEAERSIALWGWVNLAAARYGEEHLGPRYLRIRFEDLCASPVEIASEILRFFELPGDPARALHAVFSPGSLGRWRGEPPTTIAALEEHGAHALVELGYELSRA